MKIKKTALIILDGWGHGKKDDSNPIFKAYTPFIDSLYKKYPNSELRTFGEFVGLPKNQMGNSEVGHLNIGAGRIIYQDLMKINKACNDNSISEIENLKTSFKHVKKNKTALHLIGLLSDGGVHSHQNHLYKLCELAEKEKIKDIYIHVFTDGRDCDPKSSVDYISKLKDNLRGARIASVCGRYYAMDRDNRWERIKKAYDLLTKGIGEKSNNIIQSINKSYSKNITDEFISPIVNTDKNNDPIGIIKNNDAVICFNFRTDRCRQITTALSQKDFPKFNMKKLNLHYTTMTTYNKDYKNVNVIFKNYNIKNSLGEVLEKNNVNQLRIAETEKYPHVTFFFSGGKEDNFKNEKRIMIESPKVNTYDLLPEMSGEQVTIEMCKEMKEGKADFICLNYANPDMVGHTGNYKSIIKAIEAVDCFLKKVVETALKNKYALLIISDHGNAEHAVNNDGSPNTAHTKNLVPCFLLNTNFNKIKNGKLADIAPTILKIMGINIPDEMTGETLI
tara:strand:- start:418 stop:1932 length:1515 start_codon:yes stop_codon:yes gene_type:complete